MKSEPVILPCDCGEPFEVVTDFGNVRRPRCGKCQASIRKAQADEKARIKAIRIVEDALFQDAKRKGLLK
jgi:hypothetical protein